ncbi:MAG TPA: GNAT family N-acetyltransferase [Balneolaceae bacterium]|nr:GNAT family N-acetyltransferase [Balneolaceae bacterium]
MAINIYPTLETERMQLRKPVAKDIPHIVNYAGNPKIEEMTLNIPHPYHEKDAISWINLAYEGFEDNSRYNFVMDLKPNKGIIGCIGLEINTRFNRAELGYWVAEPYWNQGYASEATKAILRFGFEKVGLHKIYASHYSKNPASGKVMIKNGMKKEGKLKEHVLKANQYLSVIQYRLTRDEYQRLKNK